VLGAPSEMRYQITPVAVIHMEIDPVTSVPSFDLMSLGPATDIQE